MQVTTNKTPPTPQTRTSNTYVPSVSVLTPHTDRRTTTLECRPRRNTTSAEHDPQLGCSPSDEFQSPTRAAPAGRKIVNAIATRWMAHRKSHAWLFKLPLKTSFSFLISFHVYGKFRLATINFSRPFCLTICNIKKSNSISTLQVSRWWLGCEFTREDGIPIRQILKMFSIHLTCLPDNP